ncbi:MAG: cob(I)yrinic acid a,c-diamide adenosyltransferase [Gammaproteobacteria bacterium]
MGNRLSKIYTRTGDQGSTGLGDGSRVDKDDPRVEAIGTVDELNSALALVTAQSLPPAVSDLLARVQNELFDLGGELSMPGYQAVGAEQVSALEQALDAFNAGLPPLKEFILPGGGQAAAACHLARAVCRRAERRTLTLARAQTVNPQGLAYLNRLSDLLFVVARVLAREAGNGEVFWQHQR